MRTWKGEISQDARCMSQILKTIDPHDIWRSLTDSHIWEGKKNAWKGLENGELGEGIIAFVSPGSKMMRMMTSLFSLLTLRKWLLYNPGYNLRFHILRFRGVIWFWEILPISLTAWRHIALYKMALYSHLTYTHLRDSHGISRIFFMFAQPIFLLEEHPLCSPTSNFSKPVYTTILCLYLNSAASIANCFLARRVPILP